MARRHERGRAAVLLVALVCAALDRPAFAADSAQEGELLVLGAASLREVLEGLARDFEASHPRSRVRLSLAGSQELRAQIERGVAADVFVSADEANMERLRRQGLMDDPVLVAGNRPVVVMFPGSAVRSFAELPQVKRLVIGAAEVPIGVYTLQILRAAEQRFGESFRAALEGRVVSRELNVRHVLARVVLGEADAGIVYASDATAAGSKVSMLAIPAELNVTARYPAARLRAARKPELAQAFLALLRSAPGQQRFRAAGFLPAPEEASR
jgi:molybdate transport system substrate-binding protein